jgi:hypothetical protein
MPLGPEVKCGSKDIFGGTFTFVPEIIRE